MRRILVTAAGCPGFAGIVKSLREYFGENVFIVSCDANEDVYGRLLADKFYKVPYATMQEQYVSKITEIVKRDRIDVVLPLTDHEIMALSRLAKDFADRIPISSYKFIALTNSKLETYNVTRKLKGVNIPAHFKVNNLQEFGFGWQRLDVISAGAEKCIKPDEGRGSRGFFIVDEGGGNLYDKERMRIGKDLAENIIRNASGPYILMEYIPPPEYSVDLYMKGERIFAMCQRKRVYTRQGISYVGEVVNDDDVRLLIERIIVKLNVQGWGITGNLNFQVRGSPPKLLEINPRLSGSCVFCTYAGVNFPVLAVLDTMGEKLPPMFPKVGTKIYRHWCEVIENPHSHDG